jgi:uncharacterized OB-fold protein
MTVLDPAPGPYLKPLPQVSVENEEFFEGLQQREFRVPKCQNCGDYNWVPYPACRTCLSEDQVWTPVSGDATVYTFTVVHRGPGAFDAETPYAIVLGQLVEHPRACLVIANLVGTPVEDITIGMPITIAYEDVPDEGVTTYRWVAR